MEKSAETEIDLTEDLEIGNLQKIVEKARELWVLEQKITKIKETLEENEKLFNHMAKEELPAIMQEEGNMQEVPFSNGYKLKLKDVISASIPTAASIDKSRDPEKQQELYQRRCAALDWLKENGAGSIIANVVIVDIPKSDAGQTKAKKIQEFADELGLDSIQTESVHYQTLNAYVKEELSKDDGLDIPFDIFSIYVGKIATIEKPKLKKGKS